MRLDWIEIGCGDFDTLAGSTPGVGLSIEPVAEYCDRLQSPLKLCAAIGETSGTAEVWYIPPRRFARYGLAWWARGCNAIGGPHPTLAPLLPADAEWRRAPVPLLTMAEVYRRFDVTAVGLLKIDAEGQDLPILRSLIACCRAGGAWPDRIRFEANGLTPTADVDAMLEQLSGYGYAVISRNPDDVELSR